MRLLQYLVFSKSTLKNALIAHVCAKRSALPWSLWLGNTIAIMSLLRERLVIRRGKMKMTRLNRHNSHLLNPK